MPAEPAEEVLLPRPEQYCRYIFAFTPKCPGGGQVGSSRPCQDVQFGVNALSSNSGFIDKNRIAISRLSKAISNAVKTIIYASDPEKYLQINYEMAEIQAAVAEATLPLARVLIFCAPCTTAIKTAVEICDSQQTHITECIVRVEYVSKSLSGWFHKVC